MAKLLSFSGSNSKNSINKKLGQYANSLIKGHEVLAINLEEYAAPMFCIDIENETGIPDNIKKLRELFISVDAFVITCPEHNSSMPAFFKNMMDWISRCEGVIFNKKPVLLMGTSPGARGGMGNRSNLVSIFPYWGASSVHDFGMGKFYDVFDSENNKIKDVELNEQLIQTIDEFLKVV